MKKYFILLLIAVVCAITATAQNSNTEAPYMTKVFAGASIRNIEVSTAGGSISVTGGDAATQRVEVYVNGNNGRKLSNDEIQQVLNQYYDLNIELSNGKLTAEAKPKDRQLNWKKSVSISFRIFAPKQVATDLTTSGGSIKISNLDGDQKFRTSGGSLNVDNVGGDIDGATSGGSIHVSNSRDNISLSTSGGSIDAADCNGKISLATSGGSLHLENLKGNIKAATSGGQIRANNIEGALSAHTSGGSVNLSALSCSLETSTSGGSMDIEVVKLYDFVKVSNSGGSINLKLPKDKGLDLHLSGDKVSTQSLSNFSGNVQDNNIDGKLNGGGTSVVVNGNGRVSLSLQ